MTMNITVQICAIKYFGRFEIWTTKLEAKIKRNNNSSKANSVEHFYIAILRQHTIGTAETDER